MTAAEWAALSAEERRKLLEELDALDKLPPQIRARREAALRARAHALAAEKRPRNYHPISPSSMSNSGAGRRPGPSLPRIVPIPPSLVPIPSVGLTPNACMRRESIRMRRRSSIVGSGPGVSVATNQGQHKVCDADRLGVSADEWGLLSDEQREKFTEGLHAGDMLSPRSRESRQVEVKAAAHEQPVRASHYRERWDRL